LRSHIAERNSIYRPDEVAVIAVVVALRGVDGDHAQPFRPGFPVWNLWTVQYTPASGSEFRTAPLWGLGQRIFFLHDCRTKDLLEAIRAHVSPSSEAKGVV